MREDIPKFYLPLITFILKNWDIITSKVLNECYQFDTKTYLRGSL